MARHHIPHLRFTRLFSLPSVPMGKNPLVCTFSTFPPIESRWKTFSRIFQECSVRRALNPGKQAHGRMLLTGFQPTVFVTNCLMHMYVKCGSLEYASHVFDRMRERDTVSWNTMIFGYAGCGKVGMAQSFFDRMPERDVISWNALISGYLHNGDYQAWTDIFVNMGRLGMVFDHTTFAISLKACSDMDNFDLGIQMHGNAVRRGFVNDLVAGSALVDMYAKCKKLDDSLQVFHEMHEKNWVSWSAAIAGCAQNDQFIKGLELFKKMLKMAGSVSQSIYASLFRSCAGLSAFRLGTQLHGHALKTDFGFDVIVGTATLDMYAKCNSMREAQKLFNSLPKRNLQSYNAIIVGYARSGQGLKALELFHLLQKSGLGFDQVSLSAACSASAMLKGSIEGLQLHGLAVKSCLASNICVGNAMLDMYGKCGCLYEACCVFDEMGRRDAVSWNAIIAAHEQNENEEETLSLFVSMLQSRMEPDEFTYGSVLKACAGQQALNYGMEIHNRIIKSRMGLDWFVGSALVDMYCKCGMMEEAEKIHDRIEEPTIVSWNAMISGFSLQKQSEKAQIFFSQMLEEGLNPDNFTYATVLDTCANLATIGLGKQIHAQILKLKLQSDVYITSTLVDMYSKCGNMQESQLMFEKAPKRDPVTWNAMICGYANHGLGEEALVTFENMQLENMRPSHATFVSVLRACAHIGDAEKGWQYFHSMLSDYGLDPQLEHYSCMVDILGRSGKVNEAFKLIQEMPCEADAVIWRTLLSICKIHGNVEVAEKAVNSILQLEPQDSAAYILLSNIYANAGMWGEVTEMRKIMRYNCLKKEPGCSWIEVKDEFHTFLVGDKAHPRCKEIYEKLDMLIDEMKWDGYVPGIVSVLDEEIEGLQEQEDLRSSMYALQSTM